MLRNAKGYTLAELMVVIVIFLVVMGLTTTSFNRIVSSSGQTMKRAETEIEGLIGLELLRSDLELAGYGLPWSFQKAIVYQEANSGEVVAGYPGTNPAEYNDAPNNPPRAIVSTDKNGQDNGGFNGSDYLVLKGTALGTKNESRKWTFVRYSSVGAVFKPAKSTESELSPNEKAKVIALRSVIRGGVPTKELVMDDSVNDGSGFYFPFNGSPDDLKEFMPKDRGENFLVYGVDDLDKEIVAPFNRADYYIKRPANFPKDRCASNTGVLYKQVFKGELYPLLECVADMQVVYGFSQDAGYRGTDLHLNYVPPGKDATARDVREQVKEIRVYILAHEGGRDRDYHYPSPTVTVGQSKDGTVIYGRSFDLLKYIGTDYAHYRWKVYTIVVQPKNLT